MMIFNGYPFASRAQILARISAEPAFAVECVRTINARRGWMASHIGAAEKLMAWLDVDSTKAEVLAEAKRLAARYGKTLAKVLRERQLADRPDLVAAAVVFGVVRVAPATVHFATTGAEAAIPSPLPTHATCGNDPLRQSPSSSEARSAPPRKRGRPKGSKNRSKDARRAGRGRA